MSKKTIHQEFRQFVDNFLGEEHGCLPYLNRNNAERILSLSFMPPDIVSPDEIKALVSGKKGAIEKTLENLRIKVHVVCCLFLSKYW